MNPIVMALTALERFVKSPKVIIALFIGVFAWYLIHVVKETAYAAGYADASTKFLQAQVEQNAEFEKQRVKLEHQVQELQKAVNEKSKVINETTHKDLEVQDAKTESIIADLRADNKRLSISVKRLSAAKATAELAAGVAGDYATSRAELSNEASEFLVRLAGDADRTAIRLQGCQAQLKLNQQAVAEYNAKK